MITTTLREYVWQEIHTSPSGEYDGVRRSMASPDLIARAFPCNPRVTLDRFANVYTITITDSHSHLPSRKD